MPDSAAAHRSRRYLADDHALVSGSGVARCVGEPACRARPARGRRVKTAHSERASGASMRRPAQRQSRGLIGGGAATLVRAAASRHQPAAGRAARQSQAIVQRRDRDSCAQGPDERRFERARRHGDPTRHRAAERREHGRAAKRWRTDARRARGRANSRNGSTKRKRAAKAGAAVRRCAAGTALTIAGLRSGSRWRAGGIR